VVGKPGNLKASGLLARLGLCAIGLRKAGLACAEARRRWRQESSESEQAVAKRKLNTGEGWAFRPAADWAHHKPRAGPWRCREPWLCRWSSSADLAGGKVKGCKNCADSPGDDPAGQLRYIFDAGFTSLALVLLRALQRSGGLVFALTECPHDGAAPADPRIEQKKMCKGEYGVRTPAGMGGLCPCPLSARCRLAWRGDWRLSWWLRAHLRALKGERKSTIKRRHHMPSG